MNKELIEKLKQNEKPFGLLGEEEQSCLKNIGHRNRQFYGDGWKIDNDSFVAAGIAYRIKPDYRSEIIECEVKCADDGWLKYDYDGETYGLTCALHYANFIGYRYASGYFVGPPRSFSNRETRAEIPTHVVFKKEG